MHFQSKFNLVPCENGKFGHFCSNSLFLEIPTHLCHIGNIMPGGICLVEACLCYGQEISVLGWCMSSIYSLHISAMFAIKGTKPLNIKDL